jgi:hypothetical protein
MLLQTTIMAVCFEGGVVLGADSRTSTGQLVLNASAWSHYTHFYRFLRSEPSERQNCPYSRLYLELPIWYAACLYYRHDKTITVL